MIRSRSTLLSMAICLMTACSGHVGSGDAATKQISAEPAKQDASVQRSNSSDEPPTADDNDVADFEELVKIANRYECPRPPKSAELVVAFAGSWRSIGSSNSNHAGIYRPGFVLKKEPKDRVRMLMGFTETTCRPQQNIRATREFTLSSPDETRDGYSIEHNHLSNFETCIQLAMIGKTEMAAQLWDKFSKSDYVDGGHPHENIGGLRAKPKSLLALAIFKHFDNKSLLPKSDLDKIYLHLTNLRTEFPNLFSKEKTDHFEFDRNQFVDDLKTTIAAKAPKTGTVEELLLKWAKSTGDMQHLGYYDRHNMKADGPAREIFDRGVASIKPLVELVEDRRLSVHMRPAFMNAGPYRYRVGDLAKRLLREIGGANAPESDEWVVEKPDLWQEWLAATDLSDDARFFETAAFDFTSGIAYQVPIRVLDVRHQTNFKKLAETFCESANPKTLSHYFTYAIRDSSMPLDEKSRLLSIILKRLPEKQKRMAVQALAPINNKLTAELVLPMIEKLPRDVNEPYWTSEAANLTHVVMHLDDVSVWRSYLKTAKNSAVGLRMEMMGPMNCAYIEEKNLDFRLAFLSAFLDDDTVRDTSIDKQKFDGPCAAFTFKKISVRNYVTMKLSSLILAMDDYPDDSWTQKQWDDLRNQVQLKLADHELPEITSKTNGEGSKKVRELQTLVK